MTQFKIKNVSVKNGDLTFTLLDGSFAVANAIRRTLLSEIKTYAFGDFKIIKNNSPFTDEYITQRITMIPVNQKDIDPNEKFILNVKGVPNDIIEFWSDQIKWNSKVSYIKSKDMIIKLKGNETFQEEVHIEFGLEAGVGRVHAKWSPVIIATYIHSDVNKFDFIIENRGFYKTENLINLALQNIIDKLEFISKSVNNPETLKLRINLLEPEFHEIIINDENHTIGNLLAEFLQPKVTYIGFIKPHPLEEIIVLKIRSGEPIVKLLTETIGEIVSIFVKNKIK